MQVYLPPSFHVACHLDYVEELPANTITQYAMIREQHIKIPKPFHGIEVLTRMAAVLPLVLKFTDPAHSHMYPGYLIADFTRCTWGGWYMSNLPVDSVYEPANTLLTDSESTVKRGTPIVTQVNNTSHSTSGAEGGVNLDDSLHEASRWMQIEFLMRDDPANQYETLGLLRDVQSLVLWEGKKLSIPNSVVRMNVVAPTKAMLSASHELGDVHAEENVDVNAKGHDGRKDSVASASLLSAANVAAMYGGVKGGKEAGGKKEERVKTAPRSSMKNLLMNAVKVCVCACVCVCVCVCVCLYVCACVCVRV
jgi:hypothetical protein